MQIKNMSGASIVFSLCVQRVSRRRRFWRFSGDASRTMQKLNFTKQPSSSGRLQKSGYGNGSKDETHFNPRSGPLSWQACQGRVCATGETEYTRRLATVDLGTYRSRWPVCSVAAGRRGSLRGNLSFEL